jgi:hypothetical protein
MGKSIIDSMSFCELRAPGSISGENKRNKKGSKIKQTNRSAPGLTGLAEKEKKEEKSEREADTIILMPVTDPFPLHQGTQGIPIEGTPCRIAKTMTSSLHRTRKPTKAGRELAYNNCRF